MFSNETFWSREEDDPTNTIQHFSHEHPLSLTWIDNDKSCFLCEDRCEEVVYSCEHCDFYIHRICSQFTRRIVHPFHPQHPLILPIQDTTPSTQCSACGEFWCADYQCQEGCGFYLHTYCASLTPKKGTASDKDEDDEERDGKIRGHSSNPPTWIHCETKDDTVFNCQTCCRVIEKDSIYVSLDRRMILDKSCTEILLQEIKHPFHPDHTLTLFRDRSSCSMNSYCNACGDSVGGYSFHCLECNSYDLHLSCSFLMPVNTTDDREYVSHPHPLIRCRSSNEKFPLFCACTQPFQDDDSSFIFHCADCKRLLHKSCAEMPLEIKRHIFHPQHPLLLTLCSTPEYCDSSRYTTRGLSYLCKKCNFRIHCGCALSTPVIINSKIRHKHQLVFFDVPSHNIRCATCELRIQSRYLRCVPCNFQVHLTCIPTLPLTISDGIHRHPLTFTKSWIRDHDDEDETAEFYCDHCEKERRLHEPTYYCAKCHYVSHVHCLISEVLRVMEEEWSLARKRVDTNSDTSNEAADDLTNEEIEMLRAKIEEQEAKVKRKEAKVKEKEAKLEASKEDLKALMRELEALEMKSAKKCL